MARPFRAWWFLFPATALIVFGSGDLAEALGIPWPSKLVNAVFLIGIGLAFLAAAFVGPSWRRGPGSERTDP
jgi:hypothetical protein